MVYFKIKNKAKFSFFFYKEPFDLTNTARSVFEPGVFRKCVEVFKKTNDIFQDTQSIDRLFEKKFTNFDNNNYRYDSD